MKQKERILTKLPKKDCGLCGAPNCETFAEDCAWGEADLTDCIYLQDIFIINRSLQWNSKYIICRHSIRNTAEEEGA